MCEGVQRKCVKEVYKCKGVKRKCVKVCDSMQMRYVKVCKRGQPGSLKCERSHWGAAVAWGGAIWSEPGRVVGFSPVEARRGSLLGLVGREV